MIKRGKGDLRDFPEAKCIGLCGFFFGTEREVDNGFKAFSLGEWMDRRVMAPLTK